MQIGNKICVYNQKLKNNPLLVYSYDLKKQRQERSFVKLIFQFFKFTDFELG